MNEQEKRANVIKGMECCLPMTTRNGLADCKQCPYDRKITLEGGVTECCHDLMADALALLKAQEPVETTIGRAVEHDGHDSWWYQCGKCEKPIDWQDNYCRHCGMAVKWDG